MAGKSEFYESGQYDCRHTFDKWTFDFDWARIVTRVERGVRRGDGTLYEVATDVAKRELGLADWPTKEEWSRDADWEKEEDCSLYEAYSSWKRGFIDCATPRLREWILDKIEARR